ncbi:unnamed protein product [Merluccius merluccius]
MVLSHSGWSSAPILVDSSHHSHLQEPLTTSAADVYRKAVRQCCYTMLHIQQQPSAPLLTADTKSVVGKRRDGFPEPRLTRLDPLQLDREYALLKSTRAEGLAQLKDLSPCEASLILVDDPRRMGLEQVQISGGGPGFKDGGSRWYKAGAEP